MYEISLMGGKQHAKKLKRLARHKNSITLTLLDAADALDARAADALKARQHQRAINCEALAKHLRNYCDDFQATQRVLNSLQLANGRGIIITSLMGQWLEISICK